MKHCLFRLLNTIIWPLISWKRNPLKSCMLSNRKSHSNNTAMTGFLLSFFLFFSSTKLWHRVCSDCDPMSSIPPLGSCWTTTGHHSSNPEPQRGTVSPRSHPLCLLTNTAARFVWPGRSSLPRRWCWMKTLLRGSFYQEGVSVWVCVCLCVWSGFIAGEFKGFTGKCHSLNLIGFEIETTVYLSCSSSWSWLTLGENVQSSKANMQLFFFLLDK